MQPEQSRYDKAKPSYRATVAKLASAQKSSKGAPAYSRFINRRLGRYLAAAGYQFGLTPNMITAVSAIFSFAGIAVLALIRPAAWVGILVCLLLVIGYALDAADGQLARLRGGGSPAGEWLDHVVDCAKISALHLAVLICWYRFFELSSAGWLLVPIGFTVVAAVMFFATVLNDQLRRSRGAFTASALADGAERPSIARSLIVAPMDYGLLCLVFLVLGATDVFFVVYTLLLAANTVFLALASVKWFRDMARL